MDPIGAFLNNLGIAPNTLTLTGLLGNLISSIFLARGQFLVGGLIALAMGPLDALDGTMARLRGESTDFGAFVDSVTDRYSELLIYGGLLAFYLQDLNLPAAGLVFAAAGGSVLVSYVKARAESLGYQVKGGILTRAERFVVLIPSMILNFPMVGIALVAVLANITALQRILVVRRQAARTEQ
jgi:CDP-diacylglycerol--glycerol-3-phosphate 3-phosphatidyltransferase